MSHFPSIWSDLIRDLINFGENGSLDLNIVLSDPLVFRMVYSPKYFCDFTQLFQNNISIFPKVINLNNNPAWDKQWVMGVIGYSEKQRYYFKTIV